MYGSPALDAAWCELTKSGDSPLPAVVAELRSVEVPPRMQVGWSGIVGLRPALSTFKVVALTFAVGACRHSIAWLPVLRCRLRVAAAAAAVAAVAPRAAVAQVARQQSRPPKRSDVGVIPDSTLKPVVNWRPSDSDEQAARPEPAQQAAAAAAAGVSRAGPW